LFLVKDRYGDVDINGEYAESSSTDESEDDDAKVIVLILNFFLDF
jgi:hypothetical protein